MAFAVYVIESISSGRRYVGYITDVVRRLAEHKSPDHKRTKYTSKQTGPWRLIHLESYPGRSEAMRRERWLKTGAGRWWLDAKLDRASPPRED